MKHIASCSFGKDSMATIILAHENKEPLDEIVYCEVMFDEETSGEVPEHAQFVHEVAIPKVKKDFGYKVNVVRSEKNYVQLFKTPVTKGKHEGQLRGSPVCFGCWVQRDLKVKPLERYWKMQGKDTKTYVGIAKDEEARLQRLAGGVKISLLDKYGITEADTYSIDEKYGLLSPIYEFAPRNGCFFCPNAKEREFRHLRDYHRDLWDRMLELERLPGVIKKNYNREMTLAGMEYNFDIDDRQISIFDYIGGEL